MPSLLRRIAVLVMLSATGIGLLAPLSARSATSVSVGTVRLLAAADPARAAPRSLLAGRERSAELSLAGVVAPIRAEALTPSATPPAPVGLALEAAFWPLPTAEPPRAAAVAPRSVAMPIGGATLTGTASYYCCTLGYGGQAVVALPGALGSHYDPPPASRYVTICADRCARLPVVDYCACYWGTPSQRIADLSPEAWVAISDLDRHVAGVVRVTIHFG